MSGLFQHICAIKASFTLWNVQGDKLEPQFANNNHIRNRVFENCVFQHWGGATGAPSPKVLLKAANGRFSPGKPKHRRLTRREPLLAKQLSGKSEKVFPGDPVLDVAVHQGSSTDLAQLESGSLDLVITDPFWWLHYSEPADFSMSGCAWF